MATKEKPVDRERKDWSEDGQVFLTGGKGYGLTEELKNTCLGTEADILEAFKTGDLADYLEPVQHQVLASILEYRKEVLVSGREFEPKRNRDVRIRPPKAFKRRAAYTRQAPPRKRLPVHKA